MLEQRAHHKELKRPVNEIEGKRRNDTTYGTWFDIRTLKKLKLKAKDKLNEIKQKLQP